jgi:hypothetical protein
MCEAPETEVSTDDRNPLTRTDAPWSERTTTLDRQQRVGGDPLAPKLKSAPSGPMSPTQKKRMEIEKEGYDWYESMEGQVSTHRVHFPCDLMEVRMM